jgi:Holliday junction resolvase RusA-like endonuclease
MFDPRPLVQCVVLRLPPPVSVNAMYRTYVRGGRVASIKSERYREWVDFAASMIADQNPGRIEGHYGLTIKMPKKNRIDLCNAAKCINDAAQAAGIIENDRLCRRLLVEPGVEDETVCFFISTKGE